MATKKLGSKKLAYQMFIEPVMKVNCVRVMLDDSVVIGNAHLVVTLMLLYVATGNAYVKQYVK